MDESLPPETKRRGHKITRNTTKAISGGAVRRFSSGLWAEPNGIASAPDPSEDFVAELMLRNCFLLMFGFYLMIRWLY